MRAYADLTERGQARRLRRLAEHALAQFGIEKYRLRLLKHLVNTTFALTTASGRYLLRIHRVPEHSPERIASELAWLDALARETDVAVQAPLEAPDGRMVVMAEAPGVPEPLPVTILTWIKGRVLPQDRRGLREFRHLGRLLAKLHQHAANWQPPVRPDRRTYDAEGIFGAKAAYPLAPPPVRRLPREIVSGLEKAYHRLQKIERELGRGPEHFGFIHFDLSFSNVLFTAKEARPIDFDECGFGYFLGDIAVALAGPYGGEHFQARYEALITGYREIGDLPGGLLRHLPAFLSARTSVVMLYNAHRRYEDGWRSQWEERLKLQLDERLFPVRWEI